MALINFKPLCIGLTGGIGSGKTTAAHFFKKFGAAIIDADDIAHEITKPCGIAYQNIIDHFGNSIVKSDKTLDRKKLRDVIFENPEEKKWLENLLHPFIRQKINDFIATVTFPYCICVIPLLVESEGIDFIDRVLVIDTPIADQITRAKKRDNTTDEMIQKIILTQASQTARLNMANDVILNAGDLKTLENQVRILHEKYLHLMEKTMHPEHSPLGKKSAYINHYTPELLFPIARKIKRDEIHVPTPLPFCGYDLWNAFEISWLNEKGKPIVATAEIIIPAFSPCLIESKSLKLYFNSFNQTVFENKAHVEEIIIKDLSTAAGSSVLATLHMMDTPSQHNFEALRGICIDALDVKMNTYQPCPDLLTTKNIMVSETIHSHLLKSNCLVTGQPDWGSVEIDYTGPQINHPQLLQYIVSFRDHNEFHEQCVERIFMDILTRCNPTELTVYARYTRRGGLDINPYRSTHRDFSIRNPRLIRQ